MWAAKFIRFGVHWRSSATSAATTAKNSMRLDTWHGFLFSSPSLSLSLSLLLSPCLYRCSATAIRQADDKFSGLHATAKKFVQLSSWIWQHSGGASRLAAVWVVVAFCSQYCCCCCNVDTCNIWCVGPTVMDDIVADFVAVCRPFEVAYKLPDNIADALSATATRGSSATWRRKEEGEGKAEQQPWQRFNFIFYSKWEIV